MAINLDGQILLAQPETFSEQNSPDDPNSSEEQPPISLPKSDSQQTDFVTAKEFTDFQNKTSQQLEDKTSLFGMNTGDILAGSIVFELLLIVIIFLCFRSNQKELSKRLKKQAEKIDDLTRNIEQLERNAERAKNIAPLVNQPAPPPFVVKEIPKFNAPRPIERVPESRPLTPEDKYKDFVRDFNTLAGQTGFDLKQSRNDFTQKYNIRTFSCVNFEARMNEPVPSPVFDSANSLSNPDYWAYEFTPGIFAVVPNVKTYSDNHHSARAMGEVFSSNFTPGRTYNKIHVNKPAIFNGMWNLEKQGELKLS